MATLRGAIQDASSFLAASVDTASGTSLVRRLSLKIPGTWVSPRRSASPPCRVVCYCLDLLETIHRAAKAENNQLGARGWRQVHALVDIIIVLGLYRVLPPGVGPSETLRKKSVMLAQDAQNARYPDEERKPLELNIVSALKSIVDEGGEIGEALQRKNFVDIFSGIVDLSFNPEYSQQDRLAWKAQYDEIIASKLSLPSVLINLTVLLHPKTPVWIRSPLTTELSSMPLQASRHGVRTVVQFLLSKHHDPGSVQLDHIGKVIGSIPSWMKAEVPPGGQVIELLDERDPLLGRTAVHIIAFMIARHQDLVQRCILELIRGPLNPSKSDVFTASDEVSGDAAIELTVTRLEIFISEASPILLSALFQPILSNLFFFLVHIQNTFHSQLKERLAKIFKLYFASSWSAAVDALYLVERILRRTEGDGWTFAGGLSGGLAIRKVQNAEISPLGFDEIITRISTFVEILKDSSDEVKSQVFVGVIREWLAPKSDDPVRILAIAQLLQELLSNYQTELLKSPINIIQVCSEILSTHIPSTTHRQPSITTLSTIVSPTEEDDTDEFIDMALTLLSTVTTESLRREIPPDEAEAYKSCLPRLERLLRTSKNASHRRQAKDVLSLIRSRLEITDSAMQDVQPDVDDEQKIQNAMEYISDPLVPVRAQGINILKTLIQRSSSAINTDNVLGILVGLLQDDDSYVYLNAIRAIQSLAESHGPQILQKLLKEYESSDNAVDERVRLAEAAATIIQRMGEIFNALPISTEVITRSLHIVAHEHDWRISVSALGLLSLAGEMAPLKAGPALEMAVHLMKVRDLTFVDEEEEAEGAAPLRRGAVSVVAGVLKGGGIEALGGHARDVVRGVRYLARADGDETVRELAGGVLRMMEGFFER